MQGGDIGSLSVQLIVYQFQLIQNKGSYNIDTSVNECTHYDAKIRTKEYTKQTNQHQKSGYPYKYI
jgi:hypothetical protein